MTWHFQLWIINILRSWKRLWPIIVFSEIIRLRKINWILIFYFLSRRKIRHEATDIKKYDVENPITLKSNCMKCFVKYRWRLINFRFYQRTSDIYMARQFCNPKQTTSIKCGWWWLCNSYQFKYKESMRYAIHSHEKQVRFN